MGLEQESHSPLRLLITKTCRRPCREERLKDREAMQTFPHSPPSLSIQIQACPHI